MNLLKKKFGVFYLYYTFNLPFTISIKAIVLKLNLISYNLLQVSNHIFFQLQQKFLAKIIGHTINLCNLDSENIVVIV